MIKCIGNKSHWQAFSSEGNSQKNVLTSSGFEGKKLPLQMSVLLAFGGYPRDYIYRERLFPDSSQSYLTDCIVKLLSKKIFHEKAPIQYILMHHNQMSRLMTKPTKWHVRPAKTQISLGIRPV